jgi:hypothetical protein
MVPSRSIEEFDSVALRRQLTEKAVERPSLTIQVRLVFQCPRDVVRTGSCFSYSKHYDRAPARAAIFARYFEHGLLA